MAYKLTDEQRQKIIADYVINQNKSETARMNGVTEATVRKILKEDNEEIRKTSMTVLEDGICA